MVVTFFLSHLHLSYVNNIVKPLSSCVSIFMCDVDDNFEMYFSTRETKTLQLLHSFTYMSLHRRKLLLFLYSFVFIYSSSIMK